MSSVMAGIVEEYAISNVPSFKLLSRKDMTVASYPAYWYQATGDIEGVPGEMIMVVVIEPENSATDTIVGVWALDKSEEYRRIQDEILNTAVLVSPHDEG